MNDLESPSNNIVTLSNKIKEIGQKTLHDTMTLVNNFIYNENK